MRAPGAACAWASTTRRLRTGTSGMGRGQHVGLRAGKKSEARGKDFDQYLRDKAGLPQVRELLTGYGPVALGVVRYATPDDRGARAQRFTDLVRSLQPAHAHRRPPRRRRRLHHDGRQRDSQRTARWEAWETPATVNHTWGYRSDDDELEEPGCSISSSWVDIVSKGGNYLLNVGPMADGVIPLQPSQDKPPDCRVRG